VENIFKSKLENYSELPPQAVWNKIQEKRTPVYIWWNAFKLRGWKYAASVLLIMVAAVGLYVVNINTSNQQSANNKNGIAVQNEIAKHQAQLANKNSSQSVSQIESNANNDRDRDANASNLSQSEKAPIYNGKTKNGIAKVKPTEANLTEIASQKSDNKIAKTAIQRILFDRLSLNKKAISSLFNLKASEFYLNLLPYSDLTTRVAIIEPDNQAKATSVWYGQLSVGPMLATRSLKGDGALKDLRDNSEKAKLGWNVNLKIGRSIGMHWEVESGLQFMQRREGLNYNYDYTTLDQSLKITDVKIYHPNLDPKYVQVVDTVYQIRAQNVNRNQNNTYTYLSIPLIARYNFYFPKAWSVNAAAGLLTDVYQTNKGEVMANTRESVAINSIAKSTQFNQRILLSAGVKLKANEHWSILAEPAAIFGLNNMMTPGYSLKQKEFGLMFNTGLRYNF